MEQTEQHVGKLEAQLAQWGMKLDELLADVGQADADAKTDYHQRVTVLKAKYEVAQAKLKELKEASGEKWGSFKTGVEIAWIDLEDAFKELAK